MSLGGALFFCHCEERSDEAISYSVARINIMMSDKQAIGLAVHS